MSFPDRELLALCERYSLWLRQSGGLDLRGRPRAAGAAAGLDFEGHVEYAPGMPVRHVDWAIYGRTRQLYVRRFEDEAAGLLALLVDASGSMGVGGKWAAARGMAAALAYAALRELHQVAVGVIHQGRVHALPVLAGVESAPAVFAFLGGFLPAGGTALGGAFGALPLGRAKGEAVIISDFLDPAAPDAGLSYLRRRGFRVDLCRVTAPGEFELPADVRALRDPEGPGHRPAPTGGERARLAEAVTAHRRALNEAADRHGAQVLEIDASAPLAQSLERYLRQVAAGRAP